MNKLVVILIGAAAASSAFAGIVDVQFTAMSGIQGNGTTLSQSNTSNGVVSATIDGVDNQGVVCDDFSKDTNVPSGQLQYNQGSLFDLDDADFSSGFATVSGDTLTQDAAYDTCAVLVAALEKLAVTQQNAQAITDYQYAIWNLMLPEGHNSDSGGLSDHPLDSAAINDQVSAYAAVQANSTATQHDEASLIVYTPTAADASNQEFLALSTTQQSAAPEPSTWLSIGAVGLLLCLSGVRRAIRKVAQ